MAVTRNVGLVTDAHKTMIFVLILIAWLTIVAIVLNACRSAANGDRLPAHEGFSAPLRAERKPGRRIPATARPLRRSCPGSPAIRGRGHVG